MLLIYKLCLFSLIWLTLQISISNATTSVIWLGGSGDWFSADKWSTGSIPDSTSSVVIANVSYTDIIKVDQLVNVKSLHLSNSTKGTLLLFSQINISISSDFIFGGGIIEGTHSSVNFSAINIQGNTDFANYSSISTRRFLNSIKINQISGIMSMNNLELIMFKSNIIIQSLATLTLTSTNNNKVIIKNDDSRLHYNYFYNFLLNNQVVLELTNPYEQSIFDLFVDNVLYVNAAKHSDQYLWPLHPETDTQAQLYYLNVSYFPVDSHHKNVYNRSVTNVDPDQCSLICDAYEWCYSFDYHMSQQTCYFSAYTSKEIGGLSPMTSWTHYTQLKQFRQQDESYILMQGSMTITDTIIKSYIYQIDIDLKIEGTLQITDSYIRFGKLLHLSTTSTTQLFGTHSLLNFNSSLTKLNMEGTMTVSSTQALDIFIYGSSHVITGTIIGITNFYISLEAKLIWTMTSLSSKQFNSFEISNNSFVTINMNELLLSKTNVLQINKLLVNNGELLINNLNLTSNYTYVGINGIIAAVGLGNSGQSIGFNHSYAASGGSHGGFCGTTTVNCTGMPYGSALRPITSGSTGGYSTLATSTNPNNAGIGGGILYFNVKELVLDGLIDARGGNGLLGGGG